MLGPSTPQQQQGPQAGSQDELKEEQITSRGYLNVNLGPQAPMVISPVVGPSDVSLRDEESNSLGGDVNEGVGAGESFLHESPESVFTTAAAGGVYMSGLPGPDSTGKASPVHKRRSKEEVPLRAHPDEDGDILGEKPALAAYEHGGWLRSRGARLIRIMSEFMHTGDVLKEKDVVGSILFIGSARLKSPDQIEKNRKKLLATLEVATDPVEIETCSEKLDNLKRIEKLAHFYDKIADLGALCAEWTKTKECEAAVLQSLSRMPSLAAGGRPEDLPSNPCWEQRPGLVISTGGGPGVMEAANRGAARVENSRSMGLGVVLPFECGANPWVDNDLNFKYHYFFTRKFWMVYMSMAVVACPGGYGTLDELLELLTLRQTGRFKVKIPIVLFGEEFWRSTINFAYLADVGVIGKDDVDSLYFTDSPQAAFDHIRNTLLEKPMYEGPSRTLKLARDVDEVASKPKCRCRH